MLEAAVGGHQRRPQPVPAGAGHARAAGARSPRTSGAFYGLDVDPDREVLVTAGATEAIAAAVLALCEPGDEVVAFEPYYDSYAATIALAGAVRRTVVLRFPGLRASTRRRCGPRSPPRTRLVLLNTPAQPDRQGASAGPSCELVARLAREHDALVVTDEVYEHLVFDGAPSTSRVATLPGMAERTLTISSAGKTFSVTGWKVGWVHGPAGWSTAVARRSSSSSPSWTAVRSSRRWRAALRLPDERLRRARRARCRPSATCCARAARGRAAGRPARPGPTSSSPTPRRWGTTTALALCRDLPRARRRRRRARLRCSTTTPRRRRTLVRFAFCKRAEVLAEAAGGCGPLRRG